MVSRETYWDVIVGPRNGSLSRGPISLRALDRAPSHLYLSLSPYDVTPSPVIGGGRSATRLVKCQSSAMVVR
jgi:hypothetical protein